MANRRWRSARGGFRVTFTAPEDVPLPPLAKPSVDVYSTEYEEQLAEHTSRWVQATGEEASVWTIPDMLAFAAVLSYDNGDGDGDVWIRSVQQARKAPEAWQVLHRAQLAQVAEVWEVEQ